MVRELYLVSDYLAQLSQQWIQIQASRLHVPVHLTGSLGTEIPILLTINFTRKYWTFRNLRPPLVYIEIWMCSLKLSCLG